MARKRHKTKRADYRKGGRVRFDRGGENRGKGNYNI